MKVLVSAYACEPNRGSEPEIGWQWAMHLAQKCDLTVITRSNNREAVEKALRDIDLRHPKFVYIDLNASLRLMKSKMCPKSLAVMVYYSLWQKKARKKISNLLKHERYDILHHTTFGAYRLPFAVAGHGIPCVVGPVGGCENSPPGLFPEACYRIRIKEMFRNSLTWLSARRGMGMSRYSKINEVLACTTEMHEVFGRHGISSRVMPNIGMHIPKGQNKVDVRAVEGGLKLLFVGRVYYWKGLELAMQVMVALPENITLTIVGDGPDTTDLEKLIKKLNLSNRVFMVGKVSRDEVMDMYRHSDLFLFPSMHDSGGFVVLEAMASGMPVVCLATGGPALAVDHNCGVVVPIITRKKTISSLVKAVESYIDNPDQLRAHGSNAVARVKDEYDWGKKVDEVMKIYACITSDS